MYLTSIGVIHNVDAWANMCSGRPFARSDDFISGLCNLSYEAIYTDMLPHENTNPNEIK